ncbi:uncharacterized protein [Parasteatoda tepidariorum]|uniref:uncharacterized protein n=1 Tax=Parasteatoda tepidariorum TaxID=114398 RepID=UPI0039BC5793
MNVKEQAETDTSLAELLELLETKEQILKKHDSDIEDLITDPEKFKAEVKVSEENEEKILSTKIKLKSKIKEINKEINHVAELSHNTSTETVEHTFSALKLSKLEIPRFSGDSNFTKFLNCFNSAIGTNDSLSKIEKFQYLKSLLSSPAYNAVAGFELNDKNYDSCIELLQQRYGYFMPHRAVIRNDKETSRVRIVYDCSSKVNENKKSLNDSLESGINLYPNLLDIILKFRENQVAFCGDLEKANHMIEIAEDDRNYLKFLWFSDETDNSKRILQFNRLPFGLTTSSFVLACVLKFHIRKIKEDQPNCYEINSLYVDDLYYGAKTIHDAYQFSSSAIEILRDAGFNLRKLKTNCIELNELWRKNGYEENTDFGQGAGFLGLKWDPIEDKIKLDLKDLRYSLESGNTKRQVLKIISKIFDPCGFISPFVIYYWSDSKIVLHWIKGSSRLWKPFVSNRVAEVQTLMLQECWNHCSGAENPADFITRGESAVKIVSSSLRWSGPVWLSHPVNLWPAVDFCNQPDDNYSDVVKKEQRVLCNLTRLLRVTAWVKRFAHNAKPNSSKLKGPISASELQNALHTWIKTVQLLHYESEIQQLLSQNTLSKHSRIFNLNCKLNDDNLLFLQGRLQFSSDDVKTKHPVLLPSNDKFVELDAHVKIGHLGVDSTLTHLREQYWIIKGKQFVKKFLRNCLICRRYKVKPGTQVVAPLPPDRIKEQPPFDISGVDFAGPFFVTDSNNKCYLLIFTYAVTRTVHLELVINMNTDSFLLGFRIFVSRRGLCSILYSDNAKAFKKANSELKWWNQINDPQVKNMLASKNIVWKFIVEKSPWWGGFWEPQIRTVKSSLTLKELETVFLEIEAMINSRPITYLYNEPSEPSPFTPSHFLVGKRLMSLPVVKYKPNDLIVNRDSLTKMYKYQQTLLDHFWNRWRKEYLLHLRSAYTSSPPGKITSFKVNDIVLINDDRYPRNIWMLGRILEVYQGRDGNIRSLLIKTPKGDIRPRCALTKVK